MFWIGLIVGLTVGGLLAWNLLPQPPVIKEFLDDLWAKVFTKN